MKILIWPNSFLKKPSQHLLEAPNPSLVEEMFSTMREAGGVGLAAVQVGFLQQLFIAQVNGIRRVFVNPSWVKEKDSLRLPTIEGCLSTPGQFETVPRYDKIVVDYRNQNYELITEVLEGVWAQIVQHESEHLSGRFFLDHVTSARRDAIRANLRKRAFLGT